MIAILLLLTNDRCEQLHYVAVNVTVVIFTIVCTPPYTLIIGINYINFYKSHTLKF